MKETKILLISMLLLLIPIVVLGATGHAPGCTNTGYDTSCCTKEFEIGVEKGYRLVDVLVNGISQGPITSYTFGELTEDSTIEVITEKIEPVLATANGAWYTQGGTSIAKNSITSITIVNSYTPAGTVVASWDASKDQQGTITAYVESDGTGNGTYKLTIAGNEYGYIKADTSCKNAFGGFEGAEIIAGLEMLDTTSVTDMNSMFYRCLSVIDLDLSSFDTSKVTDMEMMFWACETLYELNISGFNTSNVTNMDHMFYYCLILPSLDVNSFNTSKVTDMRGMFNYCQELTSLDLSNFDTREVTDMSYMFYGCQTLTSINISSFRTPKVTTMNSMFSGCKGITEVIDVSNFDTSKVTDMQAMFYQCTVPSVDVSGFNTSNVTSMGQMFASCRNIKTLDLSGFNTSKADNMSSMFSMMRKLETITLGVNFSFKGSGSTNKCTLPTPNSSQIDGADGNWYNVSGTAFTPANVPNNVADTYYAAKRLLPVIYGDADNDGSVLAADIQVIYNYILGNTTEINLTNSDVNIDGVVDKYDIAIVGGYIAGNATLPYTGKVVIFEDNNTGLFNNQLFNLGETKALTANSFTKERYVFNGWSTTEDGTVEYADGASYTANSNITLYAVWGLYGDVYEDGGVDMKDVVAVARYISGNDPGVEINLINADVNIDGMVDRCDEILIRRHCVNPSALSFPYTGKIVIFEDNDAGNYTWQFFTTGETKALTTNTFTKEGYAFQGWSTTADGAVEYADGASYTANSNITLYAVWEEALLWNAPVLGAGMTPVNWNGSAWVETTEANWDYNYTLATAGHNTVAGDGTAKWANAQTSDGSMYVWVPRYSYMIESGYHQDVDSWSSVDTPGTGKILVKFSNGTEDDVTEGATNASEGYIAHPAFTFGTDELTGIWVAKYEASRSNATSSSAGTDSATYNVPTSKPGVIGWTDLSVSKAYDYTYNLNRSLDSHLMRNSEWGAVAYLTNAIGKIPYTNNSSSYITGNSAGSQEANYTSGVTNAWNTEGGVKASTTHNVYGIYDLSGGLNEYVSAYYTGGNSTYLSGDTTNKAYAGSLYTNRNTKYVEAYDTAYDSNRVGDAVYETSGSSSGSTAWDGDGVYAPTSSYPVFLRGVAAGAGSLPGVFSFYNDYGLNYSKAGFRVVLAVKPPTPANAPVLGVGMTPVNWNGSDWVDTTEENWDYNYKMATAGHNTVAGDGTGKWANAKTADGSMYVWIPRYSYKITSGYHTNGNSWSNTTNSGTNKIEVKFSKGIADDTSDEFLPHPAFTFGEDELEGIWVAKYEASRNDATSSSEGTGTTVTSKPGVKSWVNISASNAYDYSYNLNRTLDSHLMRNSEWGAVAYLTNAIGKIPYINNSSSYITGNAGGSQDAASASGVTNAWNTANGVKASTTHNVYGIYDLSGGTGEFVSTIYKDGDPEYLSSDVSKKNYGGVLYTNRSSKYVENFSDAGGLMYSSNAVGNAMYETSSSYASSSNSSWDGDTSSGENYISHPLIFRGAGTGSAAGIFAFSNTYGGASSSSGFRPVLAFRRHDVNAPVLKAGMTPVNWNGSDWVETTEAEWDYNYTMATAGHGTVAGDGTAKWANAMIDADNDGILESSYVWIPRYSYMIESGYTEQVNSWSSVDNPGKGKILVKFSKGIKDDVTEGAENSSEGYISHPAFTFGTDELTGIWVAKYEASRSNATSSSAGSGTIVASKPGVISLRDISVSKMYDYSYNLNRDLDSHLMRSSEWGAVAYLTNAIGKIPYNNNSSSYITGNAGGSQDAASASGVTNAWNTANGVKASTIHNVYGIYDMSGGAYEYVSAYYTEGASECLDDDVSSKTYAGSLYTNRTTKYVEKYYDEYSDSELGDAIYETGCYGDGSWDGDSRYALSSSKPVIMRGGTGGVGAGIFNIDCTHGYAHTKYGFRPALAFNCTTCNGNTTTTCDICSGNGYVGEPTTCITCSGAGVYGGECSSCTNGKKEHSKCDGEGCSTCSYTGEISCGVCGGTGWSYPCYRCDGDGTVKTDCMNCGATGNIELDCPDCLN